MSLLLLCAGPAFAAGFQAGNAHAAMATTEVERSLILARGWTEIEVGVGFKSTSGYWAEDGSKATFTGKDGAAARWLYSTEHLGIRYGITRYAEIYANVPFHYVRLTNPPEGGDASRFGLGDPNLGWKIEWFRKHAPTASVISDLFVRVPVAGGSPGSSLGGTDAEGNLPLSTGTVAIGIELAGKQQFGPLALTGGVGYTHSFAGITEYGLEVAGAAISGEFKPGDEVRLRLAPVIQFGPLAVGTEIRYVQRAFAAISTANGPAPRALVPLDGSDGWALDLAPELTANVTRGVDLHAAVAIPVRGEDVMYFPLEDLTPTRGLTWSGSVEIRY